MSIRKTEFLGPNISKGRVLKITLTPAEGEIESSILLLMDDDSEILPHEHTEDSHISEGYSTLNMQTMQFSEFEVVGAGMNEHSHSIPSGSGLRVIKTSKRGPGIINWPELRPNINWEDEL